MLFVNTYFLDIQFSAKKLPVKFLISNNHILSLILRFQPAIK